MASESQPDDGEASGLERLFTALRPLYGAWMIFVGLFSWIIARLFAGVLFIVGFIPYGIIMRIVGADPLNRGLDDERESYWTAPDAENRDLEEFKNQY